jgi:hypothetical protein
MFTSYRIRIALTTIVCAASFYNSFRHIVEVALTAHQTADVAFMYPICIDAVVLISALTLATPTGINKATKLYASLGRLFGFSATLACNLAASNFTSTGAALVSLIPGAALILTIELLIHSARGTVASRRAAMRKPARRRTRKPAATKLRSVS